MTYGEKHLLVLLARVVYQGIRITSGVYKTRKIGTGPIDPTTNESTHYLTEEEVLKEEVETAHRHVQFMQDILDNEGA